MTKAELWEQIQKKKSFLCVGLDTDLKKIPTHLLSEEDPIFEFNKKVVDATKELCVAYKPNTAFYEQYGSKGLEALEKTIDYIPDECLVIADAKRGDIGNTSDAYAKAFLKNMNCDAITVSPYMGEDAIKPYLEYEGKFAIVLGLTSNPGSKNFQQLQVNSSKRLFQEVMEQISSWGSPNQIMFVVGATKGKDIAAARAAAPGFFFLVPGVGAQGGSLKEVVKYGWDNQCCLLVNSSRGIIYAGKNRLDFQQEITKAAQSIQNQMKTFL